jgi:hypothetical protein
MPRAKRGEIWLIDLGLAQKTRPCLVLSVDFLEHERAVVTYIHERHSCAGRDSKCLIKGAAFNRGRSTPKASAASPR